MPKYAYCTIFFQLKYVTISLYDKKPKLKSYESFLIIDRDVTNTLNCLFFSSVFFH